MRRSSASAPAIVAAAVLFSAATAAAGIGSGGGSRQRGTTRLVDGLGSITAGSSSNETTRLVTGLINVVTTPVPVVLASFSARAVDGAVLLEWSLTDDSDPIGFHVYRSRGAEGPFTRITVEALSAAQRSFRDESAPFQDAAWYRISAIERDGAEVHLGVVMSEPSAPPAGLRFHANVPNPAAPSTVFRLDLPRPGAVRLSVFDASGRRRAVIFDGTLAAGVHSFPWSGDGETGTLPAGAYFYRFEALDRVSTGKVILVR